MKHRSIIVAGLIFLLTLLVGFSNMTAKPLYATGGSSGSITATKKDTSGTKLSGWKFKLYKWDGDEWDYRSSKTTGSGGTVTFSDLSYAYYKVCEEVQSGWTPQSPTASDGCQPYFQLKSGASSKSLTFVNKPPTRKIRVIKRDEDWDRLSGWKFNARNKSTNATYGPVTTNSNGEAYFNDLPLGTYEVCEVLQSGWVALNPSDGCDDITLTTNTTTSMAQVSDETTTMTGGHEGGDSNTLTFFNEYRVGKIKVYKKNANNDPLKDWQIEATNTQTNVKYGPVSTNSSGYAYIYNLPLGNYNVCEILQAGWVPVDGYSVCKTVTVDEVAHYSAADTNEDTSTQTGGGSDFETVYFKNRQSVPNIDIKKYTYGGTQTTGYGADADSPTGSDVPRIAPAASIIWYYVVHNTGEVAFNKANVTVTDDQSGVSVQYHSVISGDADSVLEPNEKWLYKATGSAKTLTFGMSGTTIVEGCKTSDNLKRPVYRNKGKVQITSGPSDYDYSHYCNPEEPGIEIKKYTNGADADDPNGADVPKIAPDGGVIWTYKVTNTGNVPFLKASVVVTDNRGVAVTFDQYLSGDSDDFLEPGEVWQYKATGDALQLVDEEGSHIVEGCKTSEQISRPTYNNVGFVRVKDYPIQDNDPSHYCNPEGPNIEIKKYTNGADADSPTGDDVPEISPTGDIIWTYVVSNTGNVPFPKANVIVTDNRKDVPAANSVVPQYVQELVGNGDDILEPGEMWQYQASGKALTLVAGGGAYIVNGCKTAQDLFRPTYNNVGMVTVSEYSLTANDPSHYCNPEVPGIAIKKYTNGADADSATGADVPKIAPNGDIIWTYVISNTGNVPFTKASVIVTDNRKDVPAANSVLPVYESELSGNGDETFDPGEHWLYKATGKALTLTNNESDYIVDGCQSGHGLNRPTYNNVGILSISNTELTANDPSHYCNPEGPAIEIKKYTNGADADDANGSDVPRIGPNGDIEWTYIISNTGNLAFPFESVTVADDVIGDITFDSELSGNKDTTLDPGERWLYKATGKAETLATGPEYVVDGCMVGESVTRPTYSNIGTVTVSDGPSDSDPSHYCNPYEPAIFIKKYTNGEDADTPTGPIVEPGSTVVWTYVVTNPGDVALSSVVVTDNIAGVNVTYVSGDTNNDSKLDLDETWNYSASGTAIAGQYANTGYVKGESPDKEVVEDDDPSHYFGESSEVAALGDRVWHDVNANGVQDDGEVGVPDVNVNLLAGDCSTTTGQSTTTGDNGIYAFPDLIPGSYCIEFDLSTLPAGFQVSPQNVGDYAKDSDGASDTGKTQSVTLPSGTTNLTLDLGIYQPASLGDYVWEDLDGDGTQDGDEPSVAGVTVTLFTCGNVQVGTPDVTDENGKYLFTGLMPGCYYVVFSNLLPGFSFTTANAENVNDAHDSDADKGTGKTPTANLISGQEYLDLDAGLVERSIDVAATPLCENDAPKLQYSVTAFNFTPVPDSVTIRWIAVDSNVVLHTFTNQPLNGTVVWPEVVLGENGVATQWPGWSLVDGKWVDNGSDLRPHVRVEFESNQTELLTVEYPAGDPDCSPGPRASLGNRVWMDEVENGVQDAGEPDVEGVQVTLFTCNDEQVGDPQFTDVKGEYLFENLVPGCYYVIFDPATLPEDFSFTIPNGTGVDDAMDSDADPVTGETPDVTIEFGDDYRDLDAGVLPDAPPPTNIPDGEQPQQRLFVFLPSVQGGE